MLQSRSEETLFLTETMNILLQAVYLPGTASLWAGALCRGQSTAVEQAAGRAVFYHRIEMQRAHQIVLFESNQSHLPPVSLVRLEETSA